MDDNKDLTESSVPSIDTPSDETPSTQSDNTNEQSVDNSSQDTSLGNGYNSGLAASNREAFERGLGSGNSYEERMASNRANMDLARARANNPHKMKKGHEGEEEKTDEENPENKNFKDKNFFDKVGDKANLARSKAALLGSQIDNVRSKAFQMMHPIEAAKIVAKKKIKAWLLGILVTCLPFILGIFLVTILVVVIAGDLDEGYNSSSNIVYEADCNYENTMVTVMDVTRTVVLDTVNLEDYVIGCAVYEIGAYGGAYSRLSEHYIKSQYLASKTWLLATKRYNSSTKSIIVTASTYDQQWCDLEKGCYDVSYGNGVIAAFPGGYDGRAAERKLTESDLEIARRYYQETYGELYLPNSYNSVITSLSGSTNATFYVDTTQKLWKKLADEGNDYRQILRLTGLTPGNPGAGYNNGLNPSDISSYYSNKGIYKLGDYCKSTNTGSSGLSEAIGDVEYLSGGLRIPIYYQDDYSDVMLAKDKTVASSGCGFTSSAMIVSYLLDKKITPREFVDDWSRRYYVYNEGMSHDLPAAAAKHYGLGDVTTTTNVNVMLEALKDGHPVMSSQGPGLFTGGGHLIVLRGVTSSGKILVSDPNKRNAVTKNYNNREFTVSEIEAARGKYFIWPKKEI